MKAKKIIIPAAIIVGVAAIGGGIIALGNSASQVTYAETVRIEQKSLEDNISVNGTIKSSEKKNVYSMLSYQVDSVNVEVGDEVKKGDVLCTINTDELQQQILQTENDIDNSGVTKDYNISDAEQRYNDALESYENGDTLASAKNAVEQAEKNLEEAKRQAANGKDTTLPSSVRSADASVESAKMNYDNAVKAYEDAVKALEPENYSADMKAMKESLDELKGYLDLEVNHKYNKELSEAKGAFEAAEKEYKEATETEGEYAADYVKKVTEEYNEKKAEYEAMEKKYDRETLEDQIKSQQTTFDSAVERLESARDNAKNSMDSAKLAYDNAVAAYDTAVKQSENTEEDYSVSIKNAEDALRTAQDNYDLAARQAESELSSLKKAAEKQRTVSGLNDTQVIMLENLKDKLEYAVVTAPCDGIITAVNAEEGASAVGALFTIENIDSLEISAYVGEYDIPYVKEGMDVVIRCDALGETEFSGKVTDVAKTPAVSSASQGTNYAVEVSISDGDERLLSGMNAKLKIISSRKDNALTVTYDALTTDEDGNDAVYVAEKDENGDYKARLVPVEIGLETDYEIEVISSELKEGMYVLTDTSTIMDGSTVMINEAEAQEE